MKLQLALDLISLPEAKKLLREVEDLVDIVEVGTPFIIQDGVGAVRELRAEFPGMTILADLKIMDGGRPEAAMACQAGADIVTVLAAADDETIRGATEEAHKHGKQILADLIAVSDIAARTARLDELGVDYICAHTAVDVQFTGKNSLEELRLVRSIVKNAKTAIAGGVKPETLPDIAAERPDIVIVGGAIAGSADRRNAALRIREIMRESEGRA